MEVDECVWVKIKESSGIIHLIQLFDIRDPSACVAKCPPGTYEGSLPSPGILDIAHFTYS